MKRMTKDKEHSAALGVGGGDGETTPGLTMNFLDNFCSVFVSFVSRLNRKIRVPRVLSMFSAVPIKTVSKCTQIYRFGGK